MAKAVRGTAFISAKGIVIEYPSEVFKLSETARYIWEAGKHLLVADGIEFFNIRTLVFDF